MNAVGAVMPSGGLNQERDRQEQERLVRGMFRILSRKLGATEVERIRRALPARYRSLWPAEREARPAAAIAAPAPAADPSADWLRDDEVIVAFQEAG